MRRAELRTRYPGMFFKGDRVLFVKEYRRKKANEQANELEAWMCSHTQGPDNAVLRIALEVLRRDFGVDVSPAASLTGDALLEWVQAADKVLCEGRPAALCSTSGPNLFEAFKVIDESDKKA